MAEDTQLVGYSLYPPASPLRDAEIQDVLDNLTLQVGNISTLVQDFITSHEGDNSTFQQILSRATTVFTNLDQDPTEDNIPDGQYAIIKNSLDGTIKIFANDGGTIKSVALT